MLGENHKKYRFKFDLAIILAIISSLLVANHNLPISALEIPKYLEKYRIAKTPDEREPEAVQQAIEKIPTSPPAVSRQRKQQIESPIPAPISGNNINPVSTPQATNNNNNRSRTSRSENTNPTPKPSEVTSVPKPASSVDSNPNRRPTSDRSSSPPQKPQRTNPKPARTNPSRDNLAVAISKEPIYKEINFVDFAFGILSKDDFQFQGRYYHFYKFQGKENQQIQIRLVGSADERRSSNLRLNPFMFLLDNDNNVMLKRGNDEAKGGGKDVIVFVRLPANGTYTIAVTSRNPGDIGRYSLALRDDRASYTIDESTELTEKSLVLKQNKSAYNVSKFQGKKEQLVSIRVDSLWENFSPYIVLLDSQGQTIASDNATDGKYTALIDQAKLPKDDTYYVVVISSSPEELGKYRLTIF